MKTLIQKKDEFIDVGATTINKVDSIYKNEELNKIKELVFHPEMPIETIQIGDVGEPNRVDVSRFVVDRSMPQLVNIKYAKPLIDILFSEKSQNFFKSFFDKENLYLRRCQLNTIGEGGFIGKHLDCDSNPDYLAAIIIHFDENFKGGDFIYYPNDIPHKIHASKDCLIISSCSIEHEVKKVTHGKRSTLVFFLSEEKSINKSKKLLY